MVNCNNFMYFLDFSYGVGGTSKVLLTQAFFMSQKGKNVWVVIPNDENGQHASEFDEICKAYSLKVLTMQYSVATCMETIDIVSGIRQSKDIKELFKRYEIEFVHTAQINVAVELAARECKIPHLMNIYQTDEQSFYFNWLPVYPCYHSADSELMCSRWREGLGIFSSCIRVPYQKKGMTKLGLKSNNQLYIIVLGVFCERKNQLEIIKFAIKCRNHAIPIKITFLGLNENSYGEKCKKFVVENQLENNIKFAGFVLNIEDYFAQADLMILASTVESYPGVIVESMANKVPVLSTPVAGVPELLKDNFNAFLTKGYVAEDIYEAFLRYLSCKNEGILSMVVNRAYKTYLENHTYDIIGKKLEKYYNWILNDYKKKTECSMQIVEVEKIFEKFLIDENVSLSHPLTMNCLWLIYHILEKIKQKKNKKFVIWGAGYLGSVALEWVSIFEKYIEFLGFIDSTKVGEYLGSPILEDKDDVICSCGTILVAVFDVNSCLDIMKYLEGYNKVRNEDYFLIYNYNCPIEI